MKNTKSYTIKKTRPGSVSSGKRWIWWLGGLILAIIVGVVVYKLSRPNGPKDVSAIPASNSSQNQPNQSSTDKSAATAGSSDKSVASPSASNSPIVNLAVPSGTFVSSHHISASDNSTVASTCNTTPGATCTISFTSQDGTTVRYLPDQIADKNGSVYWTWTPQSAKLTAGNWQIKATAKNGDQTKEANDALKLEVSP